MSVVRKIVDKIFLKTISISGRSINLYAAPKTVDWIRPTEIARKIENSFEESVLASAASIPEDTVDIIAR